MFHKKNCLHCKLASKCLLDPHICQNITATTWDKWLGKIVHAKVSDYIYMSLY